MGIIILPQSLSMFKSKYFNYHFYNYADIRYLKMEGFL